MGKYAATRALNKKEWRETGNYAFNTPDSEASYRFQSFLYGADSTGVYRGYITSRDSSAYMRDYIDNRHISWSDIRYPSRTYGFGSDGSGFNRALGLSANVLKLYL